MTQTLVCLPGLACIQTILGRPCEGNTAKHNALAITSHDDGIHNEKLLYILSTSSMLGLQEWGLQDKYD